MRTFKWKLLNKKGKNRLRSYVAKSICAFAKGQCCNIVFNLRVNMFIVAQLRHKESVWGVRHIYPTKHFHRACVYLY